MIFTTNELVDRTRNFKPNAAASLFEKILREGKYGKNALQARFFIKNKMRRRRRR